MKNLKTPPQKPEAGFTLIEVLVVVIMAAILAAIAAPSWFAFANRQRAAAVRSDVVQLLRSSQQDAIQLRQARRVEVVPGQDAPTVRVGVVTFDEATGNPAFVGSEQVLGGDVNNGMVSLEAYAVADDGSQVDTVTGITFDYQGLPIERENLPFVIAIASGPGDARQCVIVASLLGTLKTGTNAECEDPDVGIE